MSEAELTTVAMDPRPAPSRYKVMSGRAPDGQPMVVLQVFQPCVTMCVILDGAGAVGLADALREAAGGVQVASQLPDVSLLRPGGLNGHGT